MHELRVIRGLHRGAKRVDKCRDRNGTATGLGRQCGRVQHHLHRVAVDRGGGGFGDHAKRALCLGQRTFDHQHGADFGAVGE